MNLLFESKRDNLLLPYYEILKTKGLNISFGQFKSILLEHLTQNGGLRNLSLSSNYYLAGAARYYFHGDLTLNDDLALYYEFTPNSSREAMANNGVQVAENHKDEWNKDVCKRLNILIKILRNSYIDSIGTTWEQPEDFGTLPIDKLLKKYNAKIKKESGEETTDENTPELNRDTNVGNGYTFEIMYSHQQCKKYYEPTNPGAWCITYGQGHYDNYIRSLNIHYVIFRKNGWENVERNPEKDKWIYSGYLPKPQDDYGNSLIAFLQSNSSWKPVYITSRWNHGSGDCGSVEADHAYTLDEFMRITGVSREDLERIYQIWKTDSGDESGKTRKELNADKKNAILAAKEAQIRINGGEDIEKFFLIESVFSGNKENLKKSCLCVGLKEGPELHMIMDKGKICFEQLSNMQSPTIYKNEYFNNILTCEQNGLYMLYDCRSHKLVNVQGVVKFKAIPQTTVKSHDFYEVKISQKDIALINSNTNEPLVLPNGFCWFNELWSCENIDRWGSRNKVRAFPVGRDNTSVLEIVYDSSSREKYFYDLSHKRFMEVPEFNDNRNDFINGWEGELEPVLGGQGLGKNYFSIKYVRKGTQSKWNHYSTPYLLLSTDGKIITLFGEKYFSDIKYLGTDFFVIALFSENNDTFEKWDNQGKIGHVYNAKTNKTYDIQGVKIKYSNIGYPDHYNSLENTRAAFIFYDVSYHSTSYIFDKKVGKFLKNNYENPSIYLFEICSKGDELGDGINIYKSKVIDFSMWGRNFSNINLSTGLSNDFDYDEHYNVVNKRNYKPIEYLD